MYNDSNNNTTVACGGGGKNREINVSLQRAHKPGS